MLKFIEASEVIEEKMTDFIVCGDPGCDGYNGTAVAIYEHVLKQKTQKTFIVGDMVANGHPFYYKQFLDITNTTSKNPVYCVVGNHDIRNYEEYLGKKDYYIKSGNALFIILDNSKRYFCESTLKFLKETLIKHCNCPTFIFFHIPPPNEFVDNAIADEQWENLTNEMNEYKEHIECIFTGHVHKALDFEVDGYRVIITGGAGANPDVINGRLHDHEYHYYQVCCIDEKWHIKLITIPYKDLTFERANNNVTSGFIEEATNFLTYKLYAEQAELEGYSSISKLFIALSESEMVHARNLLLVDGKVSDTMENLKTFTKSKIKQSTETYPNYMKIEKNSHSRSGYIAFESALIAENMHVKLLKNALNMLSTNMDYNYNNYYVCQRCGYIHEGNNPIKFCPACGTSKYFFSLY